MTSSIVRLCRLEELPEGESRGFDPLGEGHDTMLVVRRGNRLHAWTIQVDGSLTDQRVFAVYFTKDKKVERVANYGMEDGKLIDFVSRTTPTAGAESTFLKGMFINLLHF